MYKRILRLMAIVPIACAGVVWADVSGTATVNTGGNFSFDTGKNVSSGGDIQFTGTSITFQGSATGLNGSTLGLSGSSTYTSVTQTILSAVPLSLYSSTPISGGSLAVNTIFAVHTNGGNFAKALITAVSSSAVSFQFTTFGTSSTTPSGPTISQVLNNYGLIPAGLPNAGISQGALFIIKGSGLADPNAQAVLQDSSKPGGLPTTLNGASVKIVDASGKTLTPAFYYALASQLALVMPSNAAIGNAQVTVTYNNQTSSAFTISIVQSAMGFNSYNGTGAGLGVATNNATGALYNYTNSIPPGTTVVLWGSGLGADAARDSNYVPAAFTINNLAHVYIGGVEAPIVYQGASGFPGLNQVDVTIPANAPKGCNVSLVGVTAAGLPTNFLTLPIGTGVCSDAAFGITGSSLQNLTGQTNVKSGFVSLIHSTAPSSNGGGTQVTDQAFALFQSVSESSYGAGGSGGTLSIPGCIVNQGSGSGGGSGTSTGLDAGTISVSGPTGASNLISIPQVPGSYYAQLASGFVPSTGGTFSFHGSGGANVGSFDTSVAFSNPLLTWTNQAADATVTRSSGVQFTWTSGPPGTLVFMQGSSSGTSNGTPTFGNFTCIAPVEALQFAVPNYVLNAMPAGSGNLSLANYTTFKTFQATGIDAGTAVGYLSYMINSTYQ